MRMELKNVFETPVTVVVRFDGVEVGRHDFAAGAKIKVEYNPPENSSGDVHTFLLQGDKEQQLPGIAMYRAQDVKGAQMLIEDASLLATKGNTTRARATLNEAIAILEEHAPHSGDLASAKARLILLDAVS